MKKLQLMSTPGKSQHWLLLVQAPPGKVPLQLVQTSGSPGMEAHSPLAQSPLLVHWQPSGRSEPEQGGGGGAQKPEMQLSTSQSPSSSHPAPFGQRPSLASLHGAHRGPTPVVASGSQNPDSQSPSTSHGAVLLQRPQSSTQASPALIPQDSVNGSQLPLGQLLPMQIPAHDPDSHAALVVQGDPSGSTLATQKPKLQIPLAHWLLAEHGASFGSARTHSLVRK
jgi:hypothetical protein